MSATPRGSLEASTIARRLDRDIRSGADRDADVRAGERGRVVDAVADHRDRAAVLLQAGHDIRLLPGQHLGEDLVDAELLRHPVADLVRVAGEHGHAHAALLEQRDRLRRLRAHHVGERDQARAPPSRRARTRPSCPRRCTRRLACTSVGVHGDAALGHQPRAGDRDRAVVDARLCTAAGQRDELLRLREWSARAPSPRPRWRGRSDAPPAPRRTRRARAAASPPLRRCRHRPPRRTAHRTTPCRPSVSVPVLSNSTTSTPRASSSASRLCTRMPAPRPSSWRSGRRAGWRVRARAGRR